MIFSCVCRLYLCPVCSIEFVFVFMTCDVCGFRLEWAFLSRLLWSTAFKAPVRVKCTHQVLPASSCHLGLLLHLQGHCKRDGCHCCRLGGQTACSSAAPCGSAAQPSRVLEDLHGTQGPCFVATASLAPGLGSWTGAPGEVAS